MLNMTVEEVKKLIASQKEKALSHFDLKAYDGINANIHPAESGGYMIVVDTPVGDVKIRSARQKTRLFASIDSAMNAVRLCGLESASVKTSFYQIDGE